MTLDQQTTIPIGMDELVIRTAQMKKDGSVLSRSAARKSATTSRSTIRSTRTSCSPTCAPRQSRTRSFPA